MMRRRITERRAKRSRRPNGGQWSPTGFVYVVLVRPCNSMGLFPSVPNYLRVGVGL